VLHPVPLERKSAADEDDAAHVEGEARERVRTMMNLMNSAAPQMGSTLRPSSMSATVSNATLTRLSSKYPAVTKFHTDGSVLS